MRAPVRVAHLMATRHWVDSAAIHSIYSVSSVQRPVACSFDVHFTRVNRMEDLDWAALRRRLQPGRRRAALERSHQVAYLLDARQGGMVFAIISPWDQGTNEVFYFLGSRIMDLTPA